MIPQTRLQVNGFAAKKGGAIVNFSGNTSFEVIFVKTEKIFLWGAVCLSLLAIGTSVWAFLKYALPMILPFAIAYGAAYGVRRFSRFMNSKIKLTEKVWSGIFVLAVSAALFFSVWYGFSYLAVRIREFIPRLAETVGGSFAENISGFIYDVGKRFGAGEDFALKVYDALGSVAASIAGGKLGGGFISALPSFAFGSVLSIIAFFAFVFGDFRISEKMISLFPKSKRDNVRRYIKGAVTGAGKYLKAQSLVVLINAITLSLGFLIIKCRKAVLIAVLVAVLDVLPVLGVGTVLVPWALYCFISGNTFRAWALIVILIAVSVVREVAEARFVGRGAGVHPVYILASVYAGYKICSVVGMILLPMAVNIAAAAVKQSNKYCRHP